MEQTDHESLKILQNILKIFEIKYSHNEGMHEIVEELIEISKRIDEILRR